MSLKCSVYCSVMSFSSILIPGLSHKLTFWKIFLFKTEPRLLIHVISIESTFRKLKIYYYIVETFILDFCQLWHNQEFFQVLTSFKSVFCYFK